MSTRAPSLPKPRPMGHVCCGARVRRIDIDSGTSTLTFTFCGRCEVTQWFADDVPIDRANATELARHTPVRRRATAVAS
jgi:hypothetical protein